MTKPKDKIKWNYIAVGLICFAAYFYPKQNIVIEDDLSTKTITLYKNIEFFKGRNSYHRLWTNETKCAFKINVAGGMASNWTPLDSLKLGDTLTIKYFKSRESELDNDSKEIPIYFLQKNERVYFNTSSYNESQSDYSHRIGIFLLVGSVLLVSRGLTIISSRLSYILAGISFGIIVILKLLDKF